MNPRIDAITLGVADVTRSRQFYEQALGGAIVEEQEGLTINLGANASPLVLRLWDAVAADAGIPGRSAGFRGFTLSYIVASADGVDEVLARAELHGGVISKAPKNALWGYSAYLTDPSGYLWKVASSKRRSRITRNGSTAVNGHTTVAQDVPITIGVADMKRTKEFYKDGLGLPVKKDYRKFVMFSGEDGTSDLGMYQREALAGDAAVDPDGSGFRGFIITHVAASASRVDTLLARAAEAGGSIVKVVPGAGSGEYSGYFADPDGNLWRVTSRG
jgi:catechol 2,3-dioxygenase-like lactoylglutathione lyase family enzyme